MTDLHDDLDDLARAADIPAGDLDAVVRRGRRRAHRARAGVGLVAVVAAVTTGVVLVSGDDDDATPIAAGAGSATGETGVTWSVAEPGSALSLMGRPATASGTQLYALSTAPGQAPTEQPTPLRVWSSADGVDWTDAGDPTGDIYLSDLDASDGRLYAVGTGPATAATTAMGTVPEMLIGASDDGGATWATAGVDIDLDAIAEHATSVSWVQREVATSGDAVVATIGVRGELDVREVLPPGDDAPNGWAITGTGVDVLGPAPDEVCPGGKGETRGDGGEERPGRVWLYTCDDGNGGYTTVTPQDAHGVERSYTWDELGIAGDALQATLGHPFVFVRTGDGTFTRTAVAMPAAELSWTTLTGGRAGFDLVVSPADGTPSSRLRSADGVTWTANTPLPGDIAWVNSAGSLGGRAVLQGSTAANEPVVVIGDEVVDIRRLLGAAADGHELYWAGGAAGDAGVVVVVGSVRKEAGITEYDSNDVDLVALWSRDGTTWDARSLDELAGQRVTTAPTAVVTADRLIVTASTGERDADGHLRQLALVGTI